MAFLTAPNAPVPIAFRKALDPDRPNAARIGGRSLVVWRGRKHDWYAADDRCPHRAAPLSLGERLENGRLECGYHGWNFDTNGKCVRIPQEPVAINNESRRPYPKACNLAKPFPCQWHDDVLWTVLASPDDEAANPPPALPSHFPETSLVTERSLEAPCSYFLQMENLLDPAHLHFVHDGFQGNRAKASAIHLSHFKETPDAFEGTFTHDHPDVPDIHIHCHLPYTVDVSVRPKSVGASYVGVRRNILYVTPKTDTTCNVLFRDVAVGAVPFAPGPMTQGMRESLRQWLLPSYQAVAEPIIDAIMDQDVVMLRGQQGNVPDYAQSRFVMPTESDRLIVAFRRWVRRQFKQ